MLQNHQRIIAIDNAVSAYIRCSFGSRAEFISFVNRPVRMRMRIILQNKQRIIAVYLAESADITQYVLLSLIHIFYQSLQAMSSFMRFSICASYCTLSQGFRKAKTLVTRHSARFLFHAPQAA